MTTQNNKLNIKTAEDIQSSEVSLEADVVVIGSGAGGAINAYELANQG